MSCKIKRSNLSGTIVCPANKSYTHRAIFMGALSGNSTIKNMLYSADTKATIEACAAFGARIKRDKCTVTISEPIAPEKDCTINVRNSGTTIRIATGIAALWPVTTTLTGDKSIQGRPMQPILDALVSIGARCSSAHGMPPLTVRGRVSGDKVHITGDISSQFITSLLICAPLTEHGITINIQGELVSRPYLDATIATMDRFGVKVDTITEYQRYRIEPQQYIGSEFTVPPDFSSMALLLAAAVLVGDDLTIRAPSSDLPHGDRAFFEMLKRLGINVNIHRDSITVDSPDKLDGGTFDLADSPDLLPPLSILALKCKTPLNITNVKHARYKETDRIALMCKELAKLGMHVNEKEDGMVLSQGELLRGRS